jgi:hypothetical protein
MGAMMAEIQSHGTQLEALASGMSSTTPPTLVDPLDKPTLNEDDPEKVEVVEGDEDTTIRVTHLGNKAPGFHLR